jgi:hypothetical protein
MGGLGELELRENLMATSLGAAILGAVGLDRTSVVPRHGK